MSLITEELRTRKPKNQLLRNIAYVETHWFDILPVSINKLVLLCNKM